MGWISLQNNVTAMNANRMLGLNQSALAKSTERLSSGYKINRAADDAAGLAISEKMRRLIRGLSQGTENAQDGISWVQIGDGALEEAQGMLHRMTELTIKSLNGTNSKSDRMAMDEEFQQLKVELDRISTTTKFNEMDIFSRHEPVHYQCEGDMRWEPNQIHVVTAGQNEITFKYRETETSPPQTISFAVPPGEYTTRELLDEIDTSITDSMGGEKRFVLEYTKEGYINATLECGEVIDTVTGGLSYLLYDVYKGGSFGALLGTTIFPTETAKLSIEDGKNDYMEFTIEYFDGRVETKKIDLATGSYTREELIQLINAQLQNSSVKASAYGTGIKLGSHDAMVTGFKGNMFRIDGGDYTSVFYDNVFYGGVTQTAAQLQGGWVLTTDSRDVEHQKFVIDNTNNTLTFQPNGAAVSVDLVFPDGEYTADEIRDRLNAFFQTEGFELQASVIRKNESIGGRTIGFLGLKIDSDLDGPDSAVGLDSNSSAFRTFFVEREYNSYGNTATMKNETTADKDAYFKGSKSLSAFTAAAPLTITANNNSFTISVKETDTASAFSDTITLATGNYTSEGDIVAEINRQFNAKASFAGKVEAVLQDHMILIRGVDGESVDRVSVSALSGNNGFEALFQGYYTYETVKTQSGNGSITLEPQGPVNPGSMEVNVNGVSHKVTFPSNPTPQQIVNAINSQIPPRTVTTPITFQTVTGRGSSTDRNFSSNAAGSETVTPWQGSAVGDSKKVEGVVTPVYSTPAKLTLGPELSSSMVLDASNNKLMLTLNGKVSTLTLTPGTYSPAALATELQKQIDKVFGTKMGGATVALSGKQLVLTSRLPSGEDGKDTSIECDTNTSSLLNYLNTTKKPAVCVSNLPLAPSIKIDGSSNQFVFHYQDGGKASTISLTLTSGTYTPASIVNEFNRQLAGKGIQASLSGSGGLALTSVAEGKNVAINFATRDCSAADALFGKLTGKSPANVVTGRDIQSPITIAPGKQDFSITVNGTKKTVTLVAGTYNTPGDFLAMLKNELNKINVDAYLSGNRLGFRTQAEGSGETLMMSYSDGGSSMEAIYGTVTTHIPGIRASWNGNKLMLEAVDGNGNLVNSARVSVSSNTSGGLQQSIKHTVKLGNSTVGGYHSRIYSKIQGVKLSGEPIAIDRWNNKLEFGFYHNKATQNISLTLDAKDYTYAELKTALQDKLDALTGPGEMTVSVDANGVSLKARDQGSEYRFSNPNGNFYWKVLSVCDEVSADQAVTDKDGDQTVHPAYIVGRKDIRSEPVEITRGVNDQLSLDMTFGGNTYHIQVTLDQGRYDADSLKQHLQEKMDEQIVDMGLKKGLLQVGVGGINSGVAGGNDKDALNFSLSKEVASPASGDVIIDGVKGSAAFEIFYQTDGKMVPAFIVGTRNIMEGVTIKPGETDLVFDVDGVEYPIQLDEGTYTADELIDAINQKFTDGKIPLTASMTLEGGKLKISHKQTDEHEIRSVSGAAKEEVFFVENGGKDTLERFVQLSSENPDKIELPRSKFSTAMIKIDSLCISSVRYATKAVDRLTAALERVSALRGTFGSIQNRLEHAVNNNRNKEENLQAAESLIRDTDMAKVMVDFSLLNILGQAGTSMLTQANKKNEMVLELLQ